MFCSATLPVYFVLIDYGCILMLLVVGFVVGLFCCGLVVLVVLLCFVVCMLNTLLPDYFVVCCWLWCWLVLALLFVCFNYIGFYFNDCDANVFMVGIYYDVFVSFAVALNWRFTLLWFCSCDICCCDWLGLRWLLCLFGCEIVFDFI